MPVRPTIAQRFVNCRMCGKMIKKYFEVKGKVICKDCRFRGGYGK